nr:MAG TPA: hypothetical protein [Caudoviricetes sp.]
MSLSNSSFACRIKYSECFATFTFFLKLRFKV